MELSRGHSESKIKSERMEKVWGKKQKNAAKGRVVTRVLPGWVNYVEATEKLTLDPAKAKTVERIFDMALAGQGAMTIARKLNDDKVPVIGRTQISRKGKVRDVKWGNTTIYYILTTRAVIGDYVPYRATGRNKKEGQPIPNYFPAVNDKDTFHAVQGALKNRALTGRGRRGKHVNLFAGMLKDAKVGGSIGYHHRTGWATLTSIDVRRGRTGTGKQTTFPVVPFEEAILSKLQEVKPKDIQCNNNDAENRIASLLGQKAELASLQKVWKAKMDNLAIVDTVAEKLTEYATKLREVERQLATAEHEAANPVVEVWEEFRSLAHLLKDDNSDETRLKVRAALQQTIESVWCLFVARDDQFRIALVQVWFKTGHSRDYVIYYDPARGNQLKKYPARLHVANAKDWDDLDLRTLNSPDNPMDAEMLTASWQRTPAKTIERLFTKSAK